MERAQYQMTILLLLYYYHETDRKLLGIDHLISRGERPCTFWKRNQTDNLEIILALNI